MPVKRSYEYVKTFIESKGCQLVSSEYNGNKEPLLVIMKCGHSNKIRFDTIVNGSKTYMCRSCSEIAKCHDNTDSVKKFLIDNECQFISSNDEIINGKTTIKYVGNCGHEIESKWHLIKNTSKLQCNLCTHKVSNETINEILEKIKCKLVSIERKYIDTIITYIASCNCTVIEKYVNLRRKTTGICSKCDGTYIYNINDVKDFLLKNHCTLISDRYTKSSDYIEYIAKCGHKTKKQFSELKRRDNFDCPKCGKLKRLELNDVCEFLKSIGCELLSTTYKGINDKLEYYGVCGHKITKEFKYIKLGYGLYCTNCIPTQSHGEKIISDYCKNNDINYINQYKFNDCKNINKLPFDFYLPEYNLIIEFDGQDHFKQNGYRGGQDKLKSRQKNDNIKTQYCFNNKIKLVRIGYSELKNLNKLLKFIIKYINIINIMLIGKEYINTKHYPDEFYEFRCTTSDKLPLII